VGDDLPFSGLERIGRADVRGDEQSHDNGEVAAK
jgi:hypothetical protein